MSRPPRRHTAPPPPIPVDGEGGQLVFGLNPVLALLRDGNRGVESLQVQKGSRGARVQELLDLARERGLRPQFVERAALDRLTDGGVHQGVVARAGVRRQPTWDGLLEALGREKAPLLLLLDGVEDPHNLGAIIRSAEAFGALAVVTPRDRAAPLSGVAVKASAGAAERLDLVRVTNLARAIQELQELGVRVYGLAGEGETPLGEADLTAPVALVMGGEGKGLRRLTRERCDGLLAIPMSGAVGSLNVSVAAGVALYECQRQRRAACHTA